VHHFDEVVEPDNMGMLAEDGSVVEADRVVVYMPVDYHKAVAGNIDWGVESAVVVDMAEQIGSVVAKVVPMAEYWKYVSR